MRHYIKNMVCVRCKMIVKLELLKLDLQYITVELGVVELLEKIRSPKREELRIALLRWDLELIDDKKDVLVGKIKNLIIELVRNTEEQLNVNLSLFLSQKLSHDYTYLANLFSEHEHTTIEKFFIAHKIERAKELIRYNELNLTDIAYLLHYSSVAHLSTQFKKVTGVTPSYFKCLKKGSRNMLEDVGTIQPH